MANDISDIRSTLNGLIETLKDGEDGFRTSAEKLKDSSIRTQFNQFAQQRARFASELQSEVNHIGGDAATSGSTSGALHRGWIGLKAALTGDNDNGILSEAERGEDQAVGSYRDALAKDLPNDIRGIVERQYNEIRIVHNEVRALRDGSRVATGTGTTRTY